METPRAGWAEQSPDLWWTAVQMCIAEIDEPQVDAIGVTGQMHGSVFLDDANEVIRPALLWCDQRTEGEVIKLHEEVGEGVLRRITGNPAMTGFQLPKILWLRSHEPENYARVRKVLLPKDYITFKLTANFATDVSDASGVGLMELGTKRWSGELLGSLRLSADLFPQIVESAEKVGKTGSGCPVVAGAGDQAAGAVGTGAVTPDILSLSLGSSGVAFASIAELAENRDGTVHLFAHANRAWHVMGVMLACGSAIAWAKSILAPAVTFEEFGRLALTAPANDSAVTFLPYLSGERCPVTESRPFGTWAGLDLSATPASLARSVFEGVTFGLASVVEAVREHAPGASTCRVTGGGAQSDMWLQMLADVLQVPIHTMEVDEGPAMGAAILAGVGIGIWPSVADATASIVRTERHVLPGKSEYRQAQERYQALYPTLRSWPSVSN